MPICLTFLKALSLWATQGMVSYLCVQVGKEIIPIAGSQLRGGSRGWRSSLAQSIPVAPVSRRVKTKSFLCLQGGSYTTCPRACCPTSSLRSQFPFAAVTNYHTLSSLKHYHTLRSLSHTFIISYTSGGGKSKIGLTGLKPR